ILEEIESFPDKTDKKSQNVTIKPSGKNSNTFAYIRLQVRKKLQNAL
ncbi:25683_t:CDS:1, partial [Racocetra persica]